jgi:hypothetical protein
MDAKGANEEKRNLPSRSFNTRYLRRRTLHLLLESARLVVEMHNGRMRIVHLVGTLMAFPVPVRKMGGI